MSTVVYKVDGKNGDYVKSAIVPANHSEEPHFGALDCVIIGFFLLCAGVLLYLFVG